MKRTTINASLLACAMLPLIAQAFGNHQTWTSGFAQGSSEYIILGKVSHSSIWLVAMARGQPRSSLRTLLATTSAWTVANGCY